MARNNFPWSSSRKIQNEESLNLEVSLKKQSILNQRNEKSSIFLPSSSTKKMKLQVSKIKSVLTAFTINRSLNNNNQKDQERLGPKVVGTLFGHRKGHVHFVLQRENNSNPVFIIEIPTQITNLVNEMATGLVRIALECDKQEQEDYEKGKRRKRLLDETNWRAFCNGKKCGFATKKEIGAMEAKILKTVEPISMGAGVLPGFNGSGSCPDGELMYMRAKFERVVGSRDSEAFYMMNPDCKGAPELSLYLLRV